MRYISILLLILSMLAPFFTVHPVAADTRYVGDQLIITLRQGKSTKHKILKTLKTGTVVEVLEEDSTYLKVRTSDGTEGYVLRQYISSNPPIAQRVNTLEKENSSLRNRISDLEQTNRDLEEQLTASREKYDQEVSLLATKSESIGENLEQALHNEKAMTKKYNTLASQAENVVKIAKERDQLLKANKKLSADYRKLQQKKEKFPDPRMIKWLLAGGGIFFFGWIIGKISRKKRSRY